MSSVIRCWHHFKTEQPIGGAVCDVIDVDTFVVYEIECHANSSIIKKKLDDFCHPLIEDLIIIDLRRMDIDWEPLYSFRDKIEGFCSV